MSVWRWALVAVGGLALAAILDALYRRFVLKLEHKYRVLPLPAQTERPRYKWVVFKGFANPLKEFAEAMKGILKDPMIVVDYGTETNLEPLFRAILSEIRHMEGPERIALYGHSRGGQIAEQFRQWYETQRLGDMYGPIEKLFLDCTPGDWRSLPGPMWVKRAMKKLFKVYKGGPILALIVAFMNWLSRRLMTTPVDNTVDRKLFKQYKRKLMWYNAVVWVVELYSMLTFEMPKPQETEAEVYYIGSTHPKDDKIILQPIAIPQWKVTHPKLQELLFKKVVHAIPVQQPVVYGDILNERISSEV